MGIFGYAPEVSRISPIQFYTSESGMPSLARFTGIPPHWPKQEGSGVPTLIAAALPLCAEAVTVGPSSTGKSDS